MLEVLKKAEIFHIWRKKRFAMPTVCLILSRKTIILYLVSQFKITGICILKRKTKHEKRIRAE